LVVKSHLKENERERERERVRMCWTHMFICLIVDGRLRTKGSLLIIHNIIVVRSNRKGSKEKFKHIKEKKF